MQCRVCNYIDSFKTNIIFNEAHLLHSRMGKTRTSLGQPSPSISSLATAKRGASIDWGKPAAIIGGYDWEKKRFYSILIRKNVTNEAATTQVAKANEIDWGGRNGNCVDDENGKFRSKLAFVSLIIKWCRLINRFKNYQEYFIYKQHWKWWRMRSKV